MGTNSQLISDLFQRTILYLTSCSSWKSIRSSSKLWSFVLFCLSLFPALAHQKNVASCTLLSCRWNRPLLAFLLISKIICHIYIMVWFLTTFFYKSLGVLTQFNSDEWLLFYGSKAWLFLFYSNLHRPAMNTLRFIISNGTVWHSVSAQIFYFFIHNCSKKSVSSQKSTENPVIMRLFV